MSWCDVAHLRCSAQIKKIFNVQMPGFKIGTDSPLRLPPWFTATAVSLTT